MNRKYSLLLIAISFFLSICNGCSCNNSNQPFFIGEWIATQTRDDGSVDTTNEVTTFNSGLDFNNKNGTFITKIDFKINTDTTNSGFPASISYKIILNGTWKLTSGSFNTSTWKLTSSIFNTSIIETLTDINIIPSDDSTANFENNYPVLLDSLKTVFKNQLKGEQGEQEKVYLRSISANSMNVTVINKDGEKSNYVYYKNN